MNVAAFRRCGNRCSPTSPVMLQQVGLEIDTPEDLALCRSIAAQERRVICPARERSRWRPQGSKRLVGRKVTAVACFDSFGKLAMTMLAACRREGAETSLLLLELNNPALPRQQRPEIRRIDPKTRIEKHNWNDLRQLCGAMAGNVDALILGLDGQRSRDALLQLKTIWADQEQRPRLISAYGDPVSLRPRGNDGSLGS